MRVLSLAVVHITVIMSLTCAALSPQVCANIMEYCQILLLQSSAQAQFTICLFSPFGSEPAGRDGGRAGQTLNTNQ